MAVGVGVGIGAVAVVGLGLGIAALLGGGDNSDNRQTDRRNNRGYHPY